MQNSFRSHNRVPSNDSNRPSSSFLTYIFAFFACLNFAFNLHASVRPNKPTKKDYRFVNDVYFISLDFFHSSWIESIDFVNQIDCVIDWWMNISIITNAKTIHQLWWCRGCVWCNTRGISIHRHIKILSYLFLRSNDDIYIKTHNCYDG